VIESSGGRITVEEAEEGPSSREFDCTKLIHDRGGKTLVAEGRMGSNPYNHGATLGGCSCIGSRDEVSILENTIPVATLFEVVAYFLELLCFFFNIWFCINSNNIRRL